MATLAVLKKLSPASTADAATSVVPDSVVIALFNAVFRLPAVAAGSVPMVKLPVGAGDVLVAVNCTDAEVPSGRLKLKVS